MKHKINLILQYLQEQRGYEFSGNRLSMLNRRITKRFFPTKSSDFKEYYEYLLIHPKELDKLIDILTINVSSFFRDPLLWEFLAHNILPILLEKKASAGDSLRIWSAGCASGEEPYSLAILLKEQLEKMNILTHIFATDIDKEILKKAENAKFNFEAVKNVKFGLMKKYFVGNSSRFALDLKIKEMVIFSYFDLLDEKRYIPSVSIFGNFDIVLCRNVLIYFTPEYQERIFDKLYRSLNTGGYLILGEAEIPIENYKSAFSRIDKKCKIYRKR